MSQYQIITRIKPYLQRIQQQQTKIPGTNITITKMQIFTSLIIMLCRFQQNL